MTGQEIDNWLARNQRAISLEDQQRMDAEVAMVKHSNGQEVKVLINMMEEALKRKEKIEEKELDLETRKRIASYRDCCSAAQIGYQPDKGDPKQLHKERQHASKILQAHRRMQQQR